MKAVLGGSLPNQLKLGGVYSFSKAVLGVPMIFDELLSMERYRER